jgi:hypothetical protein
MMKDRVFNTSTNFTGDIRHSFKNNHELLNDKRDSFQNNKDFLITKSSNSPQKYIILRSISSIRKNNIQQNTTNPTNSKQIIFLLNHLPKQPPWEEISIIDNSLVKLSNFINYR